MEDAKPKSDFKTKAENLTTSIGDYLDSYYKLTVLKATQKTTEVVSAALSVIVIFFFGLFVLFFSGIALGVWLGALLNNAVVGYLLVAAVYLLLIVIVVVMRKRIVFPFIRNLMIRKLYE